MDRFNQILAHAFEAGIGKYQMDSAIADTDLIMIRRIKNGNVPSTGVQSISMNQLLSLFQLLVYAMVCCFCIFVFEVSAHKVFKK